MKKWTSFLCCVLVLAALCMLLPVPAAATLWTAENDAQDTSWYDASLSSPFEISTPARLASLAKLVNDGTDVTGKVFNITQSLDLSGHEWVTIGTPAHPFTGTLVGVGASITISNMNLTSASSDTGYYGLAYCGAGAEVTNLTVTGSIELTDVAANETAVCAVIPYAKDCTISRLNSSVTVSLSGAGTIIAGGVVGEADGATVSVCRNTGDIIVTGTSAATVGGLIGTSAGTTTLGGDLTNGLSRNDGKLVITAMTADVGGIVGAVKAGSLTMLTADSNNPQVSAKYILSLGEITVNTSAQANVGGFVGSVTGTGVCTLNGACFTGRINVANDGDANSNASVGGILGMQNVTGEQSVLTDCSFTTGTEDSALLEYLPNSNATMLQVTATGGFVYTGGIYGEANELIAVTPMLGKKTGTSYIPVIQSTGNLGGIGGMEKAGKVYTDGTVRMTSLRVRGTRDGCVVGGAFGKAESFRDFLLNAEDLYVTCEKNNAEVGGIAGSFSGVANDGTIQVVGTVTVACKGEDCVIGGFAGKNTGTLQNISLGDRITVRYSEGKNSAVGGFIGSNSGTIDFCYTTAALTTLSDTGTGVPSPSLLNVNLGGLVGVNSGTISNCYRDITVSVSVSKASEYFSSVGGLVGKMTNGTVEKCYAACDVDLSGIAASPAYGGGLIGWMSGGTVSNCYAADHAVSGAASGYADGLVGLSDGTISCSYSVMSVNGEASGGYVGINGGTTLTPCSLDALKAESTFADWDFMSTWRLSKAQGASYSYPVLLRRSSIQTLNYDIRWYTEDPAAMTFTVSDEADLAGLVMLANGKLTALNNGLPLNFIGRTIQVGKAFNLQMDQWLPIETAFLGTLDGNGKWIDGLSMTTANSAGLFLNVSAGAVLKNLCLEATSVSGSGSVGAFAAVNNGTVENLTLLLAGSLESTGDNVGGIVGVNGGTGVITAPTVTLCENASIVGSTNAGGVVGIGVGSEAVSNPAVTLNAGAFISGASYVGGVAGNNAGPVISPTVILGDGASISAIEYAGGVAGNVNGSITTPSVTLSDNAYIIAGSYAGGVAGKTGIGVEISGAELSFSAENTSITATGAAGYVGGIAGQSGGPVSAEALTLNAAVSATGAVGYAGGAVGKSSDAGTVSIQVVTVNAAVSAADFAGGIVGQSDGAVSADTVTVNSAVTATGATGHAGGIAGQSRGPISVEALTVNAAVSATGDIGYAGGAVGKSSDAGTVSVTEVTVTENAAITATGAEGYAGGVVGQYNQALSGVTVSGSGTVSGAAFAGGLVGQLDGAALSGAEVEGLTVSGAGNVGGAAGEILGELTDNQVNVSSVTLQSVKVIGNNAANVGGVFGHIRGVMADEMMVSSLTLTADKTDAVTLQAGGIAGFAENSILRDIAVTGLNNTADSTTADLCVGGVAGRFSVTANAYKTYTLSAEDKLHVYQGVAYAQVAGLTIEVNKTSAESTKTANLGGLIGLTETGCVYDSSVSGSIDAGSFATLCVGGAVGQAQNDAYMVNNTVSCEISYRDEDSTYAGGFAGKLTASTARFNLYDPVGDVFAEEPGNGKVSDNYTNEGFDTGTKEKGWSAWPDLDRLRDLGIDTLTALQVESAEQFGTAALLLGDLNVAKLLTDGRVERGALAVTLTADIDLSGRPWNPIDKLQAGDLLDGQNHTVSGLSSIVNGLVRMNEGTIQNLVLSGAKVTASSIPAGLIAGTSKGAIQDVTVDDSSLSGNSYAGGVVGNNTTGTMIRVTVTDSVTVNGKIAGGIVGTNGGTVSTGSSSAATVIGTEAAGGIAGENQTTGIMGKAGDQGDVVSDATVSAPTVGGIVGINSGMVQNCDTICAKDKLQGNEDSTGRIVGSGSAENDNCRLGVCDVPVVSPASDNYVSAYDAYINSVEVIITDNTVKYSDDNVTIYYTLDGTAPSNTGTAYTGPIILEKTTMVQAISTMPRMIDSQPVSVTLTVKCAAPVAAPKSTAITSSIKITLTTATEDALIYYTVDGSTPTRDSILYSGQIDITSNTTLRALAVKDGAEDSDVAIFTYTRTVSGGGGGGSSSSSSASDEPAVTVPVTIGGKTADLTVELEEGTATVADADLKEVLEAGETDIVTVDVSMLEEEVSAIVLPAEMVEKLAEEDSAGGLEIVLPAGTVKLDADVLSTLANSAQDVLIAVREDSKGTTVDVTVNGKTADIPVQVELPATKNSQVLVQVNADGTESVIRKSVVENGTAYAELPAGATVKAVNRKKTFADVSSGAWYAGAVAFASSHELFEGTDIGFEPDTTMSRAMLATVLFRLENAAAEGISPFPDVADGVWYADAVIWANANGIVTGTGRGFEPNAPVTREQIAAMLYRYANLLGLNTAGKASLQTFADGEKTSVWAQEAMSWAVSAGLFQGDENGDLNPKGNATRAVVATLLQRMVGLIVK